MSGHILPSNYDKLVGTFLAAALGLLFTVFSTHQTLNAAVTEIQSGTHMIANYQLSR